MKIEELLKEVKIRFLGEKWEYAKILEGTQQSKTCNHNKFSPKVSELEIWNRNGLIYKNGVWATAKITEAPKKWVVQKDETNPIWGEFCDAYLIDQTIDYGYVGLMYNNDTWDDKNLSVFEGYQYLTLEQWKHFFGKPKVGDVCILRNVGRWIIRPYIETDELVVDQAIKVDTSKSLDEIIKDFGL